MSVQLWTVAFRFKKKNPLFRNIKEALHQGKCRIQSQRIDRNFVHDNGNISEI